MKAARSNGRISTKSKSAIQKLVSGKTLERRRAMQVKLNANFVPGTTVQFGGVTVAAPKPAPEEMKKQIAAGKRVAMTLAKLITQPGVSIQKSPDTPIFTADRRDVTLVVRVLNGKATRGRFVRGKFVSMVAK